MKGFSISSLNERFWSAVVRSTYTSARSLSVFRVVTGLSLLFFFSPDFGWIGKAPQAFFNPLALSLAAFFRDFPNTLSFWVIDLALLASAFSIAVGIKAKIAGVLYGFLSIVAYSFQFSLGKIDHVFLIICLLICLSFSGWGNELALIPDPKESDGARAKSLSCLAVLICFGFFSAGFPKAVHWINLDFHKSGTANWLYVRYYTYYTTIYKDGFFLAPYLIRLPFWGLKIMDFAAVIFELSPFFCLLISRKAWHLWLFFASLFHMINLLVLSIPFLYLGLVYMTFVDFSWGYTWTRRLMAQRAFLWITSLCLGGILWMRVRCIFDLRLMSILFVPDSSFRASLWVSLIGWFIVAGVLFKNWVDPVVPLPFVPTLIPPKSGD